LGKRNLFGDPDADVSGCYVINQETKASTCSLDIGVENRQIEAGKTLASSHQAAWFDRFSGATCRSKDDAASKVGQAFEISFEHIPAD
jgi:hypothetical protein